jgi:hypothetical protein
MWPRIAIRSCRTPIFTAERTLHPARMLTESLTPRPELENSQGQSRWTNTPDDFAGCALYLQ